MRDTGHHQHVRARLDQPAGCLPADAAGRAGDVPVIDQLQTRGLVARNPDHTDRRRHAVTLTATGTRLLTRLRRAAEERLLTPLTTTERRTLHALLTKLFAAGGAV